MSWIPHCAKWGTKLVAGGRSYYLGLFTDEREAARVYDRVALALRGSDIIELNFPDDPSIVPATLDELRAERKAALEKPRSRPLRRRTGLRRRLAK